MITAVVLATVIELIPKYGKLGQLPIEVCFPKYQTAIEETYTETHRSSSIVNEGERCGDCWVSKIVMDGTGVIKIHCENYR